MAVEFPTNKVVMIIAFENFRDEEFFVTKEVLESHGNKVDVASDTLGTAKGSDGADIFVDAALDKIDLDDYDAIVFIGGPDTLKRLDNKDSYNIAQAAFRAGKIVAAICIAPIILAKAGVLKNKNATVWSSRLNRKPIKTLKEYGADYKDEPVMVDGNVITANSKKAASDFGQAIVDKLKP